MSVDIQRGQICATGPTVVCVQRRSSPRHGGPGRVPGTQRSHRSPQIRGHADRALEWLIRAAVGPVKLKPLHNAHFANHRPADTVLSDNAAGASRASAAPRRPWPSAHRLSRRLARDRDREATVPGLPRGASTWACGLARTTRSTTSGGGLGCRRGQCPLPRRRRSRGVVHQPEPGDHRGAPRAPGAALAVSTDEFTHRGPSKWS
jgi:hypothetical protein